MNKVLVLGAGRVGRLIATELAKDCKVVVADNDLGVRTLQAILNIQVELTDLSIGSEIKLLIERHNPDLVVSALPSEFGFNALLTVVDAGLDYVDISFMPEDPMAEYLIIPGNPEELSFECAHQARSFEIWAILAYSLGLGGNFILVFVMLRLFFT